MICNLRMKMKTLVKHLPLFSIIEYNSKNDKAR